MSESNRRAAFLRKLRTLHGWLGLWGAVMGLAFGATGILLNHRNILKLPVTLMEKTSVQLSVPAAARSSPEALAEWLQAEHAAPTETKVRIKNEAATTVLFDGRAVEIPARWSLTFHSPQRAYTAEYWTGAEQVKYEKQDGGVLGTLTRLHKGYGINMFWVLLVDAFAGALILLSLTGLLMWTKLQTPRLSGVAVALALPALAGIWYLNFA
ncbi:MAG: PepSY-associated TM helix domain-containing protein [Pseudomonadota bacterium]